MRRASARVARHAAAYDGAAALFREVERRMLERLEVVRLEPEVVVDAGCGSGHALPGLEARFPQAQIVALDHSLPLLARAVPARGTLPQWLQRILSSRRVAPVAGDFGRLPFRDASVGCIWSNLALHWSNDLPAALVEWSRVLRTGGLAQFSALGPDTLHQLRGAWGRGEARRVHRFTDMHDIGDMLVAAGFADPVMDMETITLTYRKLGDLVADLRATGSTNARGDRMRGLTGKNRWRAMSDAYEALRRDGVLPATFEIIYGHAWKPPGRAGKDGVAVVRVEDIGRRRPP